MANLTLYKIISGAPSATVATALSNGNTVVETFITNADNTLYNPAFMPVLMESGLATQTDAAVANGVYVAWFVFQYVAPGE